MDLQEIEARLEAATPGPWDFETIPETGESRVVVRSNTGDPMLDVSVAPHGVRAEDAEFIAHAPEDMRALIAALERQSELIMGLEAEVHAQRQKLEAVKKLHRPISAECLDIEEIDSACAGCSGQLPNGRFVGKVVPYPCPTMRALGVTEQ